MWCTKVVYEVRNQTKPEFAYSEAFLTQLYPKETKDLRKEYWFNYLYREEETGGSSSIRPIEIIKLLNADEYKSSTIPNAGNYIVFRLADVILLYAEALNNLGEVEKALQEVNRIRQRAGAPDFTMEDDLDASIYWERVRELLGEGQYFYDLVRTMKIADASLQCSLMIADIVRRWQICDKVLGHGQSIKVHWIIILICLRIFIGNNDYDKRANIIRRS